MIYKENDEAIKSIKDRVVHGVGVRFGSPETKDFDNEWFSEKSEVGLVNGANRPFLLDHGWNRTFGKAKLADAVFEKSDEGWAYEATFLSTELGDKAFQDVISKPYRSSAGAAGHTRVATLIKGTYHLDTWLIAEQSATLSPADSENPRLTRIKSSEDYFLRTLFELQEENEENAKKMMEIISTYEKAARESREALANALTQLKEGFKNSESHFEVSDTFLTELEKAVEPVMIRT